MSCHYHVFIGPYLEVHNPIRETTEKIRSCGNPNCGRHKKRLINSSDQFCPSCGEKIRHVDVPSRGRKEFNIYDEFTAERLTEARFEGMPKQYQDYMLFCSNMNDCDGKTFYDTVEVVSMDQNTPNAQIEEFAKYFAIEIARIAEVFGKDVVKIKWGVIAYWN